VRKLISIGLILALLVTFVVPVVVAAQDQSAEDNCTTCPTADTPCPVNIPPCATRSPGGAILWALLGTTYIMGRAVGDVTEHLAGTLGCWVDVLARPVGGVLMAVAEGLGGLLSGLGDLIGMEGILGPIGDMLTSLADVLSEYMS
jgi:hypothetical protein